MDSTSKPQSGEMDNWNRMIHAKRVRERREREEVKAEDNHWNFLAGQVIATYLKSVLGITVFKGKDAAAKNEEAFKPLENIARYLAAHKDFTIRVMSGSDEVPPSDQ